MTDRYSVFSTNAYADNYTVPTGYNAIYILDTVYIVHTAVPISCILSMEHIYCTFILDTEY